MTSEDKYELIDYNSDLKLIRSKEDDMFQCQSVMSCLGYDKKKYGYIDQYFEKEGTKELIAEIKNNKNLTEDNVHEVRSTLRMKTREPT
jgi:hypothetical protein